MTAGGWESDRLIAPLETPGGEGEVHIEDEDESEDEPRNLVLRPPSRRE